MLQKVKHLAFTLLLLSIAMRVGAIVPTQPIQVNPNTQNSPVNFIFYFSLQNKLITTDYVMVTFSPFTDKIVPQKCLVLSEQSITIDRCIDLQTGTELTIEKTKILEFNPNIDAKTTVVMQFSSELEADKEYSIQIITDNVLPNIGTITSSFQFYTVTDTGVMIQENWNFGQVFLEQRQNNVLDIYNRNSMIANLPGTSFTDLHFEITIKEQTPTSKSRLKFILSQGFQFTDSSLVTTGSIINSPPQILSSQIVSPNTIITTFNEQFTVNRKFSLKIADFLNPLKITSGWISIYHLPENSMSPVQMSEESIPITTVSFKPTLTLLTIDRSVPSSPLMMYKSTTQYLTLDILLPRKLDSNFIIMIESEGLTIHEGSVYFKTSTVQMESVKYTYESNTKFKISGFPEVPSGSLLTVTMEVTHSSDDKYKFLVNIDIESQLATPIMYQSITSVSSPIPETYISGLTGDSSQANILTAFSSADSKITFTINPDFDTNDGSSLSIIGPIKLKKSTNFVDATSCKIDNVATPCTVQYDDIYTNITIASSSSSNLFPKTTPKVITIQNIKFDRTSSHTLGGVYHLYFSMRVSQAVEGQRKNLLKKVLVIPQREQLTSFGLFFSNDLKALGGNYPNIVRLVSTDTSQWTYTVQTYQRRMISIFAMKGWKSMFTTLTDGDSYPAKSNIAGFEYIYHEGSTSTLSHQNPLDWQRVDIIMNGDQQNEDFSIILPKIFIQSTLDFEVMTGVYNINTRRIRYLQIQNMITKNPPAVALTLKPVKSQNKIHFTGPSASSQNNIEIKIKPGTSTFVATTSAGAIITVSDWQYFSDSSAFNSLSISSTTPTPIFRENQQSPLSLFLPNNNKYLTYIPLETRVTSDAEFSIYLDNIWIPYSHDLPFYSIYLSDSSGTIDSSYEYINQDKGEFYSSPFRSLSFNCNENYLGITNTFCTISLNNTMRIQEKAIIRINLYGLTVSTDTCRMKSITDETEIPVTCESNVGKDLLTLTLDNDSKLDALKVYQIQMYGIAIDKTTMIHYAKVEVSDSAGSYVIEEGQKILLTQVQSQISIELSQMRYSKNNPIVYSEFTIFFNTPRKLMLDENFAIVMSKDLANLNTLPSKLNIVLKDNLDNILPIIWKISLKNYMIIFEDLVDELVKNSYKLYIYGIKTPSTIQQDLVKLIYLRKYDSVYTVSNTQISTAQFPPLSTKVDSKITMTSKFNTEGLEHELNFVIINQYAIVTANTKWIINFPRYYSKNLWNNPDYEKYCTIDDIKIPCEIDINNPYQIQITSSPKIINVGQTYNIKVYGLTCPRKKYLNGAADYVTESIFLGVSDNQTAVSYNQYSELFVTQSIIDITGDLTYGDLKITKVTSSNMQVLQTTFFVVTLTCSQAIPANSYIFFTFPEQFDNFNDIDLTVLVKQGSNDEQYTADVVNRRIGFQLSGMSLTATNQFQVEISSLPTPSQPGSIDMNKIKVMVSSSDQLTTIAASLQRHNLVSTMIFKNAGLHIVINNYNTIQVTAGTYSLPILVKPSSQSTFESNMKISFVSESNAFTFSPENIYGYLGQQSTEFKIGVDPNLVPKYYTFDIIKSEASISAVYSSLSKYTVVVTNNPIIITIPSTLDVPLGGCSVPYLIKLMNPPYDEIQINFEFDSSLLNSHLFWVNEEMSFNTLQFSTQTTERWLSFCSDHSLTQSAISVSSYIEGNNYKSYKLSSDTISITIVSNSTTNQSPTLSIDLVNIQKTYAGLQITTNLNGQLYYELKLSDENEAMSIVSLKSEVKQGETINLQEQADFLKRIYTKDRDRRVGMKFINAGTSSLEFQDVLPEKKYSLCAYFENQHRQLTAQKCVDFTTKQWGSVIRATVRFNSKIYQNQLNRVLCFYVRTSQSLINQIVDLQGHSCSLSKSPQNYNYYYPGITLSSQLEQTHIYFIRNQNLTTDPSQGLFIDSFDSDSQQITQASLSMALSQFSINYIETSTKQITFSPIEAINNNIKLPQFSFSDPIYNSSEGIISMGSLTLSEPGSVYFLLVFNKRLISDEITNHYDIQIQETENPSFQGMFNCQNSNGQKGLDCRRVIFLKDKSKDIEFTNVTNNSVYVLYYLVANEYPLRPIYIEDVKNITIDTSVLVYESKFVVMFWGLLAVSIVIIL